MLSQMTNLISKELKITEKQVENVIKLLNEGSSIPFISRYRKEVTDNLDEVAVKYIDDRKKYLDELAERKQTIIETIESQGKLTDELKKKIEDTLVKTELEDIYAPYKPKKRTRGTIAKEKGLEPVGNAILEQIELDVSLDDYLSKFFSKEKGVETVDDVLKGGSDIVAEIIADNADYKKMIREIIWKEGTFTSRALTGKENEKSKYEMYYDYSESLKTIPSHRILAMRRGEKDKHLILNIVADEVKILSLLEEKVITKPDDTVWIDILKTAIKDSYKRLIKSSLDTEIRMELKELADKEAIKMFSVSLRELLLSAPLGNKIVLGIDPGIRTGCKTVILSKTGDYEVDDILFLNSNKETDKSKTILLNLVKKYNVEYIAIGNGTGSRELKEFVETTLKENEINNIVVLFVNESGASVYSASDTAREEFPDMDLTVRGAISIGRRLQDPLAELVKIDPKSIGVGQYQHDVNQKLLKKELSDVVVSCVNFVGVDLNTASHSLLEYVSGISKKVAKNIVSYRTKIGKYSSRNDLKKVDGIGDKVFEQCAGFLRIRDGVNPLDNTSVHPESYYIVENIMKKIKVSLQDILCNVEKINEIKIEEFTDEKTGLLTLKDIMEELKKPGRDPRKTFVNPKFNDNIKEIDDLETDMILEGVITNITKFGAFCDIGVHQDGLIHVSQLSYKYVESPEDAVKVGQHVKVKILSKDKERNRISLTMKIDPPKKKIYKKKKKQFNIPESSPFKVLQKFL